MSTGTSGYSGSDRRRGLPRFGVGKDNRDTFDYSKVTTYQMTEEELAMVRQGGSFKTEAEWDDICAKAVEELKTGKQLGSIAKILEVKTPSLHGHLKKRKLPTTAKWARKVTDIPEKEKNATEAKLEPDNSVEDATMQISINSNDAKHVIKQHVVSWKAPRNEAVNSELQQTLDNLRKEYDQWRANYDTIQRDNTRLEIEMRDLAETLSIKEKELARLQGEINRLTAELQDATSQQFDLQQAEVNESIRFRKALAVIAAQQDLLDIMF
ncbi:hypothetical protein MUG87_01700 [Ectobacillus sp. JY-23]|uniref:hypothetical protein n=1 Tax=Ectobacillus sp. JY-23 TaxID=2933872 RepID=UPI001FF6C2FA|nr:hypothetical protein [Ectobacillus sp. JY-23]UOY92884.1 hypothetical protein MUG87_01700 [Ectobacillus sp. JY-23]